jgi:glutamate-1-semialdehyde 2,1-aminomutase
LAFLGGYHGSAISFPEAAQDYSMNSSYEFVLAPYNDIEGTNSIVSALPPQSLAAVIVEGMQGAGGCIPGSVDFLQHLRKLATEQKALLILDEVMTSRLSYRGLQSQIGVKPDITTLGKWPGGGMSFGAFGGRRDVMEMFDPRNGKLVHSGTFNNNVVTMAAGLAGCAILDEPTINKLNSLGDSLRMRITEVIGRHLAKSDSTKDSPLKMCVTGLGSLLNIKFAGPDKDVLQAMFYHHMLEHGIYLATRGFMALNIELREGHIDIFVKAVEDFVVKYQDVLA